MYVVYNNHITAASLVLEGHLMVPSTLLALSRSCRTLVLFLAYFQNKVGFCWMSLANLFSNDDLAYLTDVVATECFYT